MRLIDRGVEKRALREVLDGVRAGTSRALVLRGEPGVGKSALLDYAVAHAQDMQVVQMVAAESEHRLAFACAHRLLMPLLPALDHLPDPQRHALSVAFGLRAGPAADPFLVGLAALTLVSEAAEARAVLWVVDDAQWLDHESSQLLAFVARRLLADRVGVLAAARDSPQPQPLSQALPELRVNGLPDQAAYALVESSVSGPIDAAVAAHLVSETMGNPLAVVEAARALTPEQLSGAAPLTGPLAVGHRLEEMFSRRARELPEDSQTLLLLAAAGSPSESDPLWRAAADLGIPEAAATPAERADLVTFWPQVRFPHPLVRSAVYHSATSAERRRAHRALANASEHDPVARAWHLAAGAARRDEAVAATVEAAAEHSRSRGGYAATALLLERAAQLTPDAERRAERDLAAAHAHARAGTVDRAEDLLADASPLLHDPRSSAEATRLRGRIAAIRGRVAGATAALVDAARAMQPIDALATRDVLLAALESAAFAGWGPNRGLLDEIAVIARHLPSVEGQPTPPTLLLEAQTTRLTAGYAAAAPRLREAVAAFLDDGVSSDVDLGHLTLASICAVDLLDAPSVDRLTTLWIDTARRRGELARLAGGLAFRGAFVAAPCGRLPEASRADAEATELGEVTHNPAIVPPTGAHRVIVAALAGEEAVARETAAAVAREAPTRSAEGEAALAAYGLGILEIALGNYAAAVECLAPAYADDTPLIATQALPDLVEASARGGRDDLAHAALERLAERARSSGTALALALLARSQALVSGPDRAHDRFEESLSFNDPASPSVHAARTHLLYGEWLRRQRLRREARDQLRTALEMFEGGGLESFAERCRVELRATGERVRKKVLGEPEELTPREAQIAALVSAGEGNRQIAAQLFVSPSTVEYHLGKIFRKLGVTSRTQLARRLSRVGGDPGPRVVSSP